MVFTQQNFPVCVSVYECPCDDWCSWGRLAMTQLEVSPGQLLTWCRRVLRHYSRFRVTNDAHGQSDADEIVWSDGLMFCALIHRYRPHLIEFDSLSPANASSNCLLAFQSAERHLGVLPLLTPSDLAPLSFSSPDSLLLLCYISQIYLAFTKQKDASGKLLLNVFDLISDDVTSMTASPATDTSRKLASSADSSLADNHSITSAAESIGLDHSAVAADCPLEEDHESDDSEHSNSSCLERSVAADRCNASVDKELVDRLAIVGGDSDSTQKDDCTLSTPCSLCGETVRFITQRLLIDYHLYHRQCFKCVSCASLLSTANFHERDKGFCCDMCPREIAKFCDTECANSINAPSAVLSGSTELTTTDSPDFHQPTTCETDRNIDQTTTTSSGETANSNVEDSTQMGPASLSEHSADSVHDSTEKLSRVCVGVDEALSSPSPVMEPDASVCDRDKSDTDSHLGSVTSSGKDVDGAKIGLTHETSDTLRGGGSENCDPTQGIGSEDKHSGVGSELCGESQGLESEKCGTPQGVESEKCDTPQAVGSVECDFREPSISAAQSDVDETNPFDSEDPEVEYPDQLNPFGSEEDEAIGTEESNDAKRKQSDVSDPASSQNPFGDDEEEEMNEGESVTKANVTIVAPQVSESSVPPPKPSRSPTPVNPFEPPPRPPPPVIGAGLVPPPQCPVTSLSPSPGGSARSSVRGSKLGQIQRDSSMLGASARYRTKRSAPKPPPPGGATETISESGVSSSCSADPVYSTAGQSPRGQSRRVKGPAPSLPVPDKRQVNTTPLKQLESMMETVISRQLKLEQEGVQLEHSIRQLEQLANTDSDGVYKEDMENMKAHLFGLMAERNLLLRRQTQLVYMQNQICLERQHAELEHSIRQLMAKSVAVKTNEDRNREQELIERLMEIVERRDRVATFLEEEHLKETGSAFDASQIVTDDEDEVSEVSSPTGTKKKDKNKIKIFSHSSRKHLARILKHSKHSRDGEKTKTENVDAQQPSNSQDQKSRLKDNTKIKKKHSMKLKKMFS